jgi:5,10-methylenetetrahydromethanopterin reductase
VPIILAATGPRMLALAGSQADGALISGTVSVPYLRQCLAQVSAESGGRTLTNCGLVYAAVDGPSPALRRTLGFILRGAHHAPNIAAAGVTLDQEALCAAYAAEDWPAVDRLISPEVVAGHAACGDAGTVRARLEAYRDAGLDHVVLAGLAEPQEIADTLRILGASA